MKRAVALLGALLILAAGVWAARVYWPGAEQPAAGPRRVETAASSPTLEDLLWEFQLIPLDGATPPPFTLETLGGARIALADLRGRAALVYFWHTT